MSPLPSPTPVRNVIVRLVFSPIGLLCGFVVLLITTCPSARGEDSFGSFGTHDGLRSSVVDLSRIEVAPPAARPVPAIGRSTRFDRAPASLARSATPMERQLRDRGAAPVDATAVAGAAAPVSPLVNPLTNDASSAPAVSLTPMTGPAVGIRPQVPRPGR
ncbi:MAG: hypothetical protein ACKOSQ_10290 [Planctomycetaceae bacterium]